MPNSLKRQFSTTFSPRDIVFPSPPASVTPLPSSVNEQAPFVAAATPPTVSSSEPLKLQRCTSPELVAAFEQKPAKAEATITHSIAARFNHVLIVFIFLCPFDLSRFHDLRLF